MCMACALHVYTQVEKLGRPSGAEGLGGGGRARGGAGGSSYAAANRLAGPLPAHHSLLKGRDRSDVVASIRALAASELGSRPGSAAALDLAYHRKGTLWSNPLETGGGGAASHTSLALAPPSRAAVAPGRGSASASSLPKLPSFLAK